MGLIKKIYRDNRIKFICAGMINTTFGYLTYAILIFLGLSYTYSLTIATVSGVAFNYFSFGKIFLRKNAVKFRWKFFLKFIVVYIFLYIVNLSLLGASVNRLYLNPYIAQLFAMPITVMVSWILMNHWVYQSKLNDK